jgi:hypothetical protein
VSTGSSDQHSSVEFTSQNLVDGARVELAFHGCRPWVIPLYEPPSWGEMRESNSRDWSHNPVPKPFGQSRHKTSGAGRVNRTLVGEVQALCTSTVLDQQNCLELARSLELRSGAYRAPALPVELYQRSWRGDSNADHGLTRPVLFPLSYASAHSGGGGENCTPDDLLCRQMPCCLGYATSQNWSGRRDSNPRSRRWQRRVLATRRLPHGASSESRTRVISLEG